MISLKSMTKPSFEGFKKISQSGYASRLARVEEIPYELALQSASEQFQKLVPDGTQTSDQFFFDVFENQSGRVIGFLWLGLQTRFGRRIATINDILIQEKFRGKGYGKELIKLAEKEARLAGAIRLRLHVFYENEAARHLYLNMGFTPTNLDMAKTL